jgi:hypothetical protein
MPTKQSSTKKVSDDAPLEKSVSKSRSSVKKAVPAKKVAPQRVATKKVAKSTQDKSLSAPCCTLVCKPEEAFWINEGPVLLSIVDLKNALRTISDAQFAYHTKRSGNDFATWIRDCFGNDACADKLKKATTRTMAVRVLEADCSC